MEDSQHIVIEEQEINLRDYLRVIQKRKYVVLLFALFTLVVVTLVTVRTTPVYEASTQVLVEKNEATSLMGRGYYNPYDPEFYETQHQLIKSQSVARKVVAILELDKNWQRYFPKKDKGPSLVATVKKQVREWLAELMPAKKSGKAIASTVPREERSQADIIADTIRAGIRVTPVKESRIMNIRFQSTNPDFARLVANTIAEAYKEEVMAIQVNASGYALQWMTKKADEERANLAASEKALQRYMKQQDIVTIEDKVTILPQQLSNLTAKLAEAQAKKSSLENIFKQMVAVRDGGGNGGDLEALPSMTGNAALLTIRGQIREAEQKVNELSQKYGPKHPVMIEAKSELRALKRQKRQEINKVIASVKSEFDVAGSQEESIRLAMAELKQGALSLNEKLTEYRILKRDVDTNRAMYDALVMQAKEKGVTESTQKVNVWMTQVAETPQAPIKPRTKKNMLLGLVLGVFGGVGMAFFIEYLDNTIKDPEDTERRFELPVIGVVELLKKEDPDRYALEERASSFAEGFKSLRTALLLSAAERPPRTVQLTSMSPQEGKTTNVVNLAISLAQTERSVLVIDADLRRPRLHRAFGLENNQGLSSYLSGATTELAVQQAEGTGVTVLSSGPIPPNPSELLGSPRFAAMLTELEQQYDMIIIDSPPVLSATDALLVSKLVEGSIVITRFGETTFERLQRGLKSLQAIDGRVIGLVINGMDMQKSNYYSYYGYYQYYSAGSGSGAPSSRA
ncbi:GumC family protein [Desulfogranum mediterraneum]|uniref:GumC family protein n=1 Tax=Desulfogranum mediterraneum TaxID=160661 RepID=UPI00042A1E0A|nr:polysaccharide biosynthesis tyrosine autokinase [Desulfogranum mediterraneum]